MMYRIEVVGTWSFLQMYWPTLIMRINLSLDIEDRPIWTAEQRGNFTISSAWNLLRKKRCRSWMILWLGIIRFLSQWIYLMDARIAKMRIAIPSKCCCCRVPKEKNIEHLFCIGNYAQDVWRIICGPMRIPFSNVPLRQLLMNL